jgi:hypothetical protein
MRLPFATAIEAFIPEPSGGYPAVRWVTAVSDPVPG